MLSPSYRSLAVRPMECLEAGFALVKEQFWLLTGVTAVGMLLASLAPLGILLGPMCCGIYLVLFARMRGERIEFSLLFKGFDYFLESLIATLVQLGLTFLVMLPSLAVFLASFFVLLPHNQAGGGGPPVAPTFLLFLAVGLVSLVTFALMLVIVVLCAFVYPLIVDRKLSGLAAIKASVAAGRANFWGLLGLVVLNGLLGIVGVICCYFGVYFVLPICFAALAHAYREVFGLTTEPTPGFVPVG